ncbi:hypothetical protein EBR57_09230, partial [bacterium]|nr:hypothetical protein [bacterium]
YYSNPTSDISAGGSITNSYGIYIPASTIATNNYSAYFGGNVGIGTTTPATQLHIDSNGYASLYLGANGTNGVHLTKESSDHSFNIWTGTFGSGSNRLKITATGLVGIGTTSPAVSLDVNGHTFVTGLLSVSPSGINKDNSYNGSFISTKSAASGQHINLIRSANAVWSIGFVYNTSTFAIGNGQAADSSFTNPVFNITTSNNVGIGTTSPAATLHTSGTVAITTATSGTTNSVILASANYVLPDATTCSGRIYWVKNTSASAITLTSAGGTIDGVAAATGLTLSQYDCYTVISNGTNWFII